MNNTAKNIIMFVVGATIGSAVTYKLVKDKFALIAQEEIDSVKETFSKRVNQDDGMKGDRPEQEVEDNTTATMEESPKSLIYRKVLGRYDYAGIDPAEKESPPEDNPENVDPDGYEQPYLISLDQFAEEMTTFDKSSIYYYEDDDTLCDEHEEIIDNPIALVGDDALVSFGEDSGDPDIVYVRNERYGTDYEIIRIHKSYQESVLGMEPEKNRR